MESLDDRMRAALERDRTIDITTIGRRTRLPRRIEMWFHNLDGRIYLTGSPGWRDWYVNLETHPAFTFHLKDSARADLPAQARLITERDERLAVLAKILDRLGRGDQLDAWVDESPLVEVTFPA
jgi:hypothetical protein